MNGDITLQAVTVVAGCVTTALTLLYSRERTRRRGLSPNRVDELFEGYGKLLKEEQLANASKSDAIRELQTIADHLRQENEKLQQRLVQFQEELQEAKVTIEDLKAQLHLIRRGYKNGDWK